MEGLTMNQQINEAMRFLPYRRYKLGDIFLSAGVKYCSWRYRRTGQIHNCFLIGWGRAINQWLSNRAFQKEVEMFIAADAKKGN
jgi:hypothetical protein